MNDEMLRLFAEHEKTDGPPLGLDSDTLARKGRTRLRALRLSAAGGATAAIALVAAVAVALTGLSTPAPADQAADGGVAQPEYPLPDDLPEPPDGSEYRWMDDYGIDESSPAATAYGEAFRNWFADNGMELKEWNGMTVHKRALFIGNESNGWDGEGTVLPYYGIRGETDDARQTLKNAGLVPYGEEDAFILEVHPRGSFKPGAGDTYEYLATCTDDLYLDAVHPDDGPEYTCDEATGPDGELVLRQHILGGPDDGGRDQTNRVIVYRADGTAVEVGARSGTDSDAKPRLSLDDLTDLALSMPDAIVED